MNRLGPFELGDLLGAGGMSRVYRARHVELGVDVAIKAMAGSDPGVDLRAEVQAMATLDHPHIARVFDQGVASGGPLGEGTPWFAMELLRSDLQRELAAAPRWSALGPFVSQLLDALAHAHAFGVVHRDLKASNVLVGRSDDLRPGLKLVDFGIAAVHPRSAKGVGTPSAMAPEQWSRGLGDVGPWTDLYALATLVWRVVTGERPTGTASGAEVTTRQRDEAFELFRPRFPVPDGLEHWLRTALSFRPSDRFACCADAREALIACGAVQEALPDRLGDDGAGVDSSGRPDPTESSHVTAPLHRWEADAPTRPSRPPPPICQVPTHWRRTLPPPASVHLAGAGVSLLPWREVPFVGRDDARDQLWRLTRRGLRTRGRAKVALTGPAGVGASALGRWWIRRLRDASGAVAAIVDHDLQRLVDALLQPLGTPGEREGRRRGLERWRANFRAALDALDALDGDPSIDLRVGATLEILRALARSRPVALFLDSPSPDVAQLIERTDELDGGIAVVQRSTGPVAAGWSEVEVPLMPRPELSLVLDHLLPVDPAAHRALVDAAGGLPAQLRADLLRALPHLRPTREGFAGPLDLLPGQDPLAALSLSDEDLGLLEVAVTTGATVQRAVWVRAARTPPRRADQLAEHLVSRGVASRDPSGFSLRPGLVAALQRRAADAGRSADHHRATARALQFLGGDPLGIVRSWLEAGEPTRAAARAVEGWRRILRSHGAMVALGVVRQVLDALRDLPEQEALHGRLAALCLELEQEIREIDPHAPTALEAWALARGWYDTAAHAARLQARVVTTDQGAVNAIYERVAREWLSRCSPEFQARILAAWYLRLERFADPRRDAILEHARATVARAIRRAEDPEGRVHMEHLAASVERARRARDAPGEAYLEVAQRCVDLSRTFAAAPFCLDLVELAHAQARCGRVDEADRTFEEAARAARWLRLGRSEAWANGNRAGLAVLQGDWDRGAELAQRALVGTHHPYLRAVLELFCAVPVARADRTSEVQATLERLAPALAMVRPIDDEVAVALEAIAASLEVSSPDVARRAREMARS